MDERAQQAPAGSLAVVIPALNEAGNIGNLIRETASSVPAGVLREIVVVDDGSSDTTAAEVAALLPVIPALRLVRHGRRAGQSAAVRTGIRAATALFVATMDGDGQNDPHDIEALFTHLVRTDNPRLALIGGIRARRRATWSKRLASRAANAIRATLLADRCPDTGCGIKVIRREVFLDLPYFSGQHRYLPALVRAYGYEAAYLSVNDRPRREGQSKYTNFGRALIGIYDLIGVSWLIRRTVLADQAALSAAAGETSRSAEREEQQCLQS
jgi:dolichol-phosphate mannosyltransferase